MPSVDSESELGTWYDPCACFAVRHGPDDLQKTGDSFGLQGHHKPWGSWQGPNLDDET